MSKSDTFWLGYHAGNTGLYKAPISFSVSGSYGGYNTGNNGMVATKYAFTRGVHGIGKAGFAGSGYGTYGLGTIGFSGTRLYGRNPGPSWSGWGNGKWGHYGRG